MKMLKRTLFACCLLLNVLIVASRELELTVGGHTGIRLQGMGVELDPHFIAQNVLSGNGTKSADWDSIVLKRLRLLGFQKLRVMVVPEWYEPVNDNDDSCVTDLEKMNFCTPEMENLLLLLNYAERNKLDVTLVFWGVHSGSFMMKEQENGWLFGPDQHEEWAENLSACLHFLLREKGYTCIKEITPVNEPDWSFSRKGGEPSEQYVNMCRILDRRLRKDGLRKLIKLNLSDNSDGGSGTHRFLDECTGQLADVADLFNSHTYIFGYETPDSCICNWEMENVRLARKAGKPHFIGEFGSNQTVGATRQRDIDSFERGILMARIVIGLLSGGACGTSYWSLLDQYYSRGEAISRLNMQQLGLWRYLKKEYIADSIYSTLTCDYQTRPQYYALGLLANTLQRGSRVFPLETPEGSPVALAVRKENGKWAYLIANPTEKPHIITILNRHLKGHKTMAVSRYMEGGLPKDESMIAPDFCIFSDKGNTKVDVPPCSFVVVSQK